MERRNLPSSEVLVVLLPTKPTLASHLGVPFAAKAMVSSHDAQTATHILKSNGSLVKMGHNGHGIQSLLLTCTIIARLHLLQIGNAP